MRLATRVLRPSGFVAGALLTVVGCSAPAAPPPQAAELHNGIKWHPGQYMSLRNSHKYDEANQDSIKQIGNEPAIAGVLRDWSWRDIETNKGAYDFSDIDEYLKTVASVKKHLIIRIENRVFGAQSGSAVPNYLKSDPTYQGGEIAMDNGVVARIWDAPVMDRYIALMQALAQRYDSNPNVEGISTSESAVGFSDKYPAPASYSPPALLTQLERYVAAVRQAWAHSAVFIDTNYLGTDAQMQALIDFAVDNAAVIGGPDVLPGKHIQSDQIMTGAAGNGTDYRGVVAIKSEIQMPELGLKYKFQPAELYAEAYNTNHANYMLWDRSDYFGTPAQQWASGVLPFLRTVNGKVYTNCPKSYTKGCVTD
jgi:hypothetical protein